MHTVRECIILVLSVRSYSHCIVLYIMYGTLDWFTRFEKRESRAAVCELPPVALRSSKRLWPPPNRLAPLSALQVECDRLCRRAHRVNAAAVLTAREHLSEAAAVSGSEAPLTSTEIESPNAAGFPGATSSAHRVKATAGGFVSFIFHEGSSSAVRKPIRINELVLGVNYTQNQCCLQALPNSTSSSI